MSALCAQGRGLSVLLTRAADDLGRVARLATADGARGERAQRCIPATKANVSRCRDALRLHVEDCDLCAEAEATR